MHRPLPSFLAPPFSAMIDAVQSHSRRALCAALNHLLTLEPQLQALLTHHSQGTLAVHWPQTGLLPAGELELQITVEKRFEPCTLQGPADVTITVLEGFLTAPEAQRLRFLRVEGDAMLAQTLALLAQRLRWDAEHDLARFIGDVPAVFLVAHAKSFTAMLAQAAKQLKTTAKALTGSLASRDDMTAHAAELEALAARIGALETQKKKVCA